MLHLALYSKSCLLKIECWNIVSIGSVVHEGKLGAASSTIRGGSIRSNVVANRVLPKFPLLSTDWARIFATCLREPLAYTLEVKCMSALPPNDGAVFGANTKAGECEGIQLSRNTRNKVQKAASYLHQDI